jgi:YHS domain-containing protein
MKKLSCIKHILGGYLKERNDKVKKSVHAIIVMFKDPICGMTIDETKTKHVSEHEGKKFYFCSAPCKSAFDKEPHKYAHK